MNRLPMTIAVTALVKPMPKEQRTGHRTGDDHGEADPHHGVREQSAARAGRNGPVLIFVAENVVDAIFLGLQSGPIEVVACHSAPHSAHAVATDFARSRPSHVRGRRDNFRPVAMEIESDSKDRLEFSSLRSRGRCACLTRSGSRHRTQHLIYLSQLEIGSVLRGSRVREPRWFVNHIIVLWRGAPEMKCSKSRLRKAEMP